MRGGEHLDRGHAAGRPAGRRLARLLGTKLLLHAVEQQVRIGEVKLARQLYLGAAGQAQALLSPG